MTSLCEMGLMQPIGQACARVMLGHLYDSYF